MKLHISLNGNDIARYNLTALDGTLNALMKPVAYKALVTNDNAASHGISVIATPAKRRVAKQDLSIPFLMRAASVVDLQRELDNLATVLVNGKYNGSSPSGVNELYIAELNRTYRLVYVGVSSYSNFGLDGRALVTLKFTEPNPNNRAV